MNITGPPPKFYGTRDILRVKGLLNWENVCVLRQSIYPGGGLLEGAS